MSKIEVISADPYRLAEQLASKPTLSDCCLVFRALCSHLENAKNEGFVFGLELGFASWNNEPNQHKANNIKNEEGFNFDTTQLARGEEFGECIAEQLSLKNESRLVEMQTLFSNTQPT